MKIINCSSGKTLADSALMADTFWARLKGLLGRNTLPHGEALILQPCSSVHTCFMKFSIDVVFLDQLGQVIQLHENLSPWRFTPIVRNAATAVELPIGTIKAGDIKSGDTLIWVGGVLNV
ncbi:MAG: DUF192 domain-containing protein [Bacillota bacterium]|nr:DUF192 domain-containing protein [Bacillota bacterium]